MQQPSEFAQKLKAAMVRPTIKPHPVIVEAQRREEAQRNQFGGPILPLRTKQQEAEVQGEVEPLESNWNKCVRMHRAYEAYARETARVVLGKIESKFQAEQQRGFKHAIKCVLEILVDSKYLCSLMEVYQVEHNHVEFAVELVQMVGIQRYTGLMTGGGE